MEGIIFTVTVGLICEAAKKGVTPVRQVGWHFSLQLGMGGTGASTSYRKSPKIGGFKGLIEKISIFSME